MSAALKQPLVLGKPVQQPAAAGGGVFELGDHQARVVVARLLIGFERFGPADVEQFAAQFVQPLPLLWCDLAAAATGGEHHAAGHVREADALGAFQVDGQTSGLCGQFLFDGVARLQVVDPLLGSLMDLVGIFLGQNGHDRQRGGRA